jgi:hypothetical protein
MQVALAQPADISALLDLAAEVEPLFGPMVADPGFQQALERNIQRQMERPSRRYRPAALRV